MTKPSASDRRLDDVTAFIVSGTKGQTVFKQGDAGAEMFIIQEGQIEIVNEYAGAERQWVVLEAGDFFGDMSLLDEVPREATARALTDYRLLRIDQSTFAQIVQEDPEIAVRMLRKLSRRLRQHQEHDARAAQIAQGPLRGAMDRVESRIPAPVAQATPAGTRTARLVETATGTEFVLADRDELTVGRVDRAAGFTPDIDLTALDTQKTLSRRHAKIVRRGGEYFVREEMGTRNGTAVNGERVTTGVEVKLADGTKLNFGLVETTFHIR